jgi:hypothetical protein
MSYLVTWKINVEAETADEAARRALEIQRDPDSTATVFDVVDEETGESETINLLNFQDNLSPDEQADIEGLCGTAGLEDELREVSNP